VTHTVKLTCEDGDVGGLITRNTLGDVVSHMSFSRVTAYGGVELDGGPGHEHRNVEYLYIHITQHLNHIVATEIYESVQTFIAELGRLNFEH